MDEDGRWNLDNGSAVYAPLTAQQPGGALTLKGSLNESATATVAAKPAMVGSDNKFQGTAQVGSGTSNVVVVATDPSANVRTNTYQVNVSGNSASFTYDANGSLTTAGSKSYEWDGANRLVRVLDNAAEVARFVYDGFGRRSQKITAGMTRTYVYDADAMLEDRPSSGAAARYVHGPGIDNVLASIESGITSYLLADHLGSILQMTNASAAVILTRQYDPWGNLLQGATIGGYAYTGREWDPEVGLDFYRARYYDPKVGRFLSEDPAQYDDGLNMYAYVGSQPTRMVDPSGLARQSAKCGPKCPPSVVQASRNLCGHTGIGAIWDWAVRRCVQNKCNAALPIHCEGCDGDLGMTSPDGSSISICIENFWKVTPTPCIELVIAHEMMHTCRRGGPKAPMQQHIMMGVRTKATIGCPFP